jgi:tetratricopeptide (TPR) repeat protein
MRLRFLLLLPAIVSLAHAQQVVKSADPVIMDPALKAKADAIVLTLREANQLLSVGDLDGALLKVNGAIEEDPRSIAAYVLRGAIYSKKKMYDKAQADYEAAHLISPHNLVVEFNLAELNFVQKKYDAARPGFAGLESDETTDIGDLAQYKVFLCDLFGAHEQVAAKDLDAFNEVGSRASYYYGNAAWDLYHHKTDDARSWLASAGRIYAPQKNGFYLASLFDAGYLPMPTPASGK